MSYASAGLGQSTADACGYWSELFGLCTPDIGAEIQNEANTPYQCNSAEAFLWPALCASAQSQGATQSPSAPLAPIVTGVDPTTGNITTATPQQQQQANVAAITNNAKNTAGIDCSLWYNQLFSPSCPCVSCNSYAMTAGFILAAFVILKAIK